MYDTRHPIKSWNLEEYDRAKFDDMWQVFNGLPTGSVIATGFVDDGLVYFERVEFDWQVVQVDNPNVEDAFPVGYVVQESAEVDAGGDIERAYVVREGAR
jgi:hypothetical protein